MRIQRHPVPRTALRLLCPRSRGALLALCAACALAPGALRADPRPVDAHTIVNDGPSFLDGFPSTDAQGRVNVVVEIPAGTNAKWEVDESDGAMRHELRDGKYRIVAYLPYPANYGMVPRTLLPESEGGDGDPLDVVLLGPALERGSVVPARLIGVMRMTDGGERDDKLLAVLESGPLGDLMDLSELDARFPGVRTILSTWFEHYKGPGVVRVGGFAGREEAQRILKHAAAAYPSKP